MRSPSNSQITPTDPTPHAAAPLAPVRSVSRREGVIQAIRRAIILGDLPPGEKLTESHLAEELQVSRPTIREALTQLVRDGLLAAEPYKGIRVRMLTAEQMRDMAQARIALDRLAIQRILADTTGRRLAAAHAAWERYERAIRSDDALARHEAHIRFHHDLWRASESSALEQFWDTTEAQISLQLAVDQRVADDTNRDVDIHRRLIRAIDAAASGDDSEIEPALDAHTMDSVDTLIAHLPPGA